MLNFVTYLLLAVAASSAKDYVSLLDDPNPPLLHQISRRQEQGINCDNAKLQENLDRLEVKMETQMQDVKRQLNALEQRLQIGLGGEIKAVLTKMEIQQQEILRFIHSPKPADEPKSKKKAVPPNFEQIGSRYLRFVKEAVNYSTATGKCFKMGGHLATIQNHKELTAISSKILDGHYWVGYSSYPFGFCNSLQGDRLIGISCIQHNYFICEADNKT